MDFPGIPGFKPTFVKITVFHAEKSCCLDVQGALDKCGAPLVIGSHYSGARLTTASVSAWVKACDFDPKKGTLAGRLRLGRRPVGGAEDGALRRSAPPSLSTARRPARRRSRERRRRTA